MAKIDTQDKITEEFVLVNIASAGFGFVPRNQASSCGLEDTGEKRTEKYVPGENEPVECGEEHVYDVFA